MKKIVIIANNSGGLYNFRKELISQLLQEGYIMTVLTPFDDKVAELKELGIKLINTSVDRRGVNAVTDLALFFRYLRTLRKEKPNLIITYTVKPNVYGGMVARLFRIPYVTNVTGLGTVFQNNDWLNKVVTLMYRTGLKNAKVVFFENEENRQIFINKKIIEKKKTYVLNGAGVNLEYYPLTEYPLDDGIIKFLFMGRIMKEKGINELFAAMKKVVADGHSVELDVVGEFEEDYRKEIHKYVNEGWLKYYGYQKDVRPFIARTHCFVLPSWHEGMANTNLESAAMGRPVITSNIHGCLEAVIDGKSGFLCMRQDVESLYMAMKKFISMSYETRKNMGVEGRKHMKSLFDKNIIVKKTIEEIVR